MDIPADIAAKYPPKMEYCERCRREHAFYPKGFWQAMARRKFSGWLATEMDRRALEDITKKSSAD